MLCKKLKASSFKASARRRAARWRRVVRTLWRASVENAGGARRCVRVGCVCGAVYAGTRGGGALAVPCCLRQTKKQGCRRQPCLLSLLDRFYLTQFGFFGSLGFFFPKKNPKSGCGVKPRIYTFPHVGAWGGAPNIPPFTARLRCDSLLTQTPLR